MICNISLNMQAVYDWRQTDRIIGKFGIFFTVNAPFVPEVSSPTDTSNFDVDESDFRHTVSCFILSYQTLVVVLRL